MKKQEVQDILDQFEEEIDPEQLMYRLYLKAKLDQSEKAVAQGDVLDHEEVVKRSRQWSA